MNIFITGKEGFIGSHLNKLFSYDPKKPIDALLHQAAITQTFNISKEDMFKSNVDYTKEVFNFCLEKGCKQFVAASSTAIYGDLSIPHKEHQKKPLNYYAESKLVMEEWCIDFAQKHNVNLVLLRYCNVYGPNEKHKGKSASMIYQLIQQMMLNKKPKLFEDGNQQRDYIFIKDVVSANQIALNHPGIDVFNIGTGITTSFRKLVDIINERLNKKLEIEYIDNPYKGSYQDFTQCDMNKSNNILGFYPKYKIEQGIEEYIHELLVDM